MTDQATDTGRPAACRMCHRLPNQTDDPTSADCGGDCMRCLAQAGDPDCIAAVAVIAMPPDPGKAISLTDLAAMSGIGEDTLLRRMATILEGRIHGTVIYREVKNPDGSMTVRKIPIEEWQR